MDALPANPTAAAPTADASPEPGFAAFVAEAEPRLRRALSALLGWERGREATAEALAYGWEHWEWLRTQPNAVGYLYRVGRSRTRPRLRRVGFESPAPAEPWVEPRLAPALAHLPARQRSAVMLVFAAEWTPSEVAEVLGVSPSTVRRHAERGLAALRRSLGAPQPAPPAPPAAAVAVPDTEPEEAEDG